MQENNESHLALQSFSVASPRWVRPRPRLPPGQMSKSTAQIGQAIGHRFLAQSHSQVTAGEAEPALLQVGGGESP